MAANDLPSCAELTVAQLSLPAAVTGGQLHLFAIGTDKGPLSH